MAPVTRSQTNNTDGDVTQGKPLGTVAEEAYQQDVKERKERLASYKKTLNDNHSIPIYKIDQSLPPEERYVALANDFAPQLRDLTSIFSDLVQDISPIIPVSLVHFLARLCLHRLPRNEQTEELRGISRAAGIEMYLLICFNTLLDSLMGCTSGGVLVHDAAIRKRMLHFRTLDWGMEPLRKVVVQLDFVDRPGGETLARSITYAGFVGVLTGVKKDLSISLNFRPYHNESKSWISNVRFAFHQLMVLLGFRESIAATLRSYLLGKHKRKSGKNLASSTEKPMERAPWSLDDITQHFPKVKATACYIIISNGRETTVFEKDRVTAEIRKSSEFIVATNHDRAEEDHHGIQSREEGSQLHGPRGLAEIGAPIDELLDESIDRSCCIEDKWQTALRGANSTEEGGSIGEKEIVRWINKWPTTNECTHYAVVLDPTDGTVFWARRWIKPVKPPEDS